MGHQHDYSSSSQKLGFQEQTWPYGLVDKAIMPGPVPGDGVRCPHVRENLLSQSAHLTNFGGPDMTLNQDPAHWQVMHNSSTGFY